MASSEKELEVQLLEAGNRLLHASSSSVDDLLTILERVEECLSKVDQSPSQSMQNALSPSLRALVDNDLLKHSDEDVKAAVAACISEITRITAPEAPYEDDQMREIFQLIVSTFEQLADSTSRSYNKRASVLETVAKVRSCVVMLDLECDTLILEMFQHFLKTIRDYHPENVISSMETILTLVLEESEDISLELLSPILASVKRDNEEVLPIAQKLVEKVLQNCATKLRPYILQALKSQNLMLRDYSEVVAHICQEKSVAVEHSEANTSAEPLVQDSQVGGGPTNEVAQLCRETNAEAASLGEVRPVADDSAKSVSNSLKEAVLDDAVLDSNATSRPEIESSTSNRPERRVVIKLSDSIVVENVARGDNLDAGQLAASESKPQLATKKRGRQATMSTNAEEPKLPDHSPTDCEKQSEKVVDSELTDSKEDAACPRVDSVVEEAMPSDNKDETVVHSSPAKAVESGTINVVSPSPLGIVLSENISRMGGMPKKKRSLKIQLANPSAVDASKKVLEGTSDVEVKTSKGDAAASVSEVKSTKPAGKKARVGNSNKDRSDSEAKSQKQSDKQADIGSEYEDGNSSSKKKHEEKRQRQEKTEKNIAKSAVKDKKGSIISPKSALKSARDEDFSQETPTPKSKKKGVLGKEKASDATEYGEDLVGSKVKVWWPKDKAFYEGVVGAFDSTKKKHKVLYTDGDVEILNLKRQRWEFIKDDYISDGEQETGRAIPDDASEMHKNKKAKLKSCSSSKEGKVEASALRVGASSSETKVLSKKSGCKPRDDIKVDGKSTAGNSKKVDGKSTAGDSKKIDGKSKAGDSKEVDGKSKADDSKSAKSGTQKAGKVKDEAPKASGKSIEVQPEFQENDSRSEEETLKVVAKAGGKPSKSDTKSKVNGIKKAKSGSLKIKEREAKEISPENRKAKSPDSLGKHSEAKSGKKRRKASS